MKKIKNNYTNFILTVIAVLLLGNLFKGEIIKPAHAVETISYQFKLVHDSLNNLLRNDQILENSHKKIYDRIAEYCR